MHLYTDEGNIDTTANHPFYVIGKGWVAAGDLAEGDEVYNLDGMTSTILGYEVEVFNEPVLVYNLEVEDLHSYFVGCVPVLVHNKCKVNRGENNIVEVEISKKDYGEAAEHIEDYLNKPGSKKIFTIDRKMPTVND